MRFYGNKYAKNRVNEIADNHRETWDAILWDIDMIARTCRVKIQGSNTLITARFPSGWSRIPNWLKINGAVRITHRGGVRGRVEISGEGLIIPTAVKDGSSSTGSGEMQDGVLTGCNVISVRDKVMYMYMMEE